MSIGNGNDYREFLNSHVEMKELTNPHWNLSVWSRALGLQSTSSLTKVLSGERKPGPKMVDRFVKYFKFNREEEAHFRSLVLLTKDKQATFMGALLKSASHREGALQKRVLELFEFRLIAEWQHLSIRELFRVKGLNLTAAKIKKLFKDEVSVETIEKSITLLKGLSLIQKNKTNEYFSADEHIQTKNEISDSAVRFYHEQKLDQAKRRLNDTTVEDREFQSLTLLISKEELPAIKNKIRNFMHEIETDLVGKKVDQLFQFQVQLFPVTENFSKKHELYQNETLKPEEKR
jgi:uncharacterized protein (TIGR02147 family)